MNTHVFNLIMQVTMVIGLLSILLLLIMPALKAFQNDNAPAEYRSVLEINDSTTASQRMTVARAKKLLEQSAAAVIEVVAVGKGIGFLMNDAPCKQDIQLLMNHGVIFTVCQRSIEKVAKNIGHPIDVIAGVRLTPDGHSYAERLKDDGYIDEFA